MNGIVIALIEAALVGVIALLPGLAWRLYLPERLPHRLALSPLLGMCSWAWWIQLVYMFGGQSTWALVSFLMVVSTAIACSGRQLQAGIKEYGKLLPEYLVCYLVCLLATSLVVWPAAGPWSADWLATYQQVEVIWNGRPLREWLLARPPMFASLAIPYLLFVQPLVAFQLSLCAVNAAALVCVRSYIQSFLTTSVSTVSFLMLFCATPFFLVNFTSFVPKFLQATLIVGAFLMMRNSQSHLVTRMAISSLLLGMALECHHSSVAYIPGVAIGWLWFGRSHPKQLVPGIAVAAIIGLFVVGVPEFRKIALYGLEEIARFNPSKAMRSSEPAWFVALMTLECKLVGYQFLVPPYIWLKDLSLGSLKPMEHYVFWLWFVCLGVLSNTFAFIVLPFLFTWKRVQEYGVFLRRHVPSVLIVGAIIAILINCVINPYYISSGNVHCGSTAVALALLILAIAWLLQQSRYLVSTGWLMLVAGCGPWVVWQCIQFSTVLSRGGYKSSGEVFDDNLDHSALVSINQDPWGYALWPWLPMILSLCLCFLVWLELRLSSQSTHSSQLSAT